jgi:CheY-like chemotaxis protein
MKILVVDDQTHDLKLADAVLTSDGHEVFSANGAASALVMIAENRPDVILLDLQLPEIDGLELIKLIRNDPATSLLPIIALTAYPDSFRKAEIMEAGADAYVAKPFDTRTLSSLIDEVVKSKVVL